mmetsp:Transcript_125728/g.363718  ORF Transcript_125728/g.363718 Transcript_125728/m.363718 type:complete len:338 (-) Transcript_125728:112-1125(-)
MSCVVRAAMGRIFVWMMVAVALAATAAELDACGAEGRGHEDDACFLQVQSERALREPWAGAAPSSLVASTALTDATHYDLFIVIPAHAREKARRDAIRKSWFGYAASSRCEACARHPTKAMFCVGNESDVAESRAEAAANGDMIVLEDYGQNAYYTDASMKTLRCISHAVRHYSFRFILKADTDSWVYLDRLLDFFDSHSLWEKRKLYAGKVDENVGVLEDPRELHAAKWLDTIYPNVTGLHTYPKHAKGAGYILGIDLAAYLAGQAEDTFEKFHMEDAGVGSWLMPIRKEFLQLNIHSSPHCHQGAVIDHGLDKTSMAERWARYTSTGNPCVAKGH